MAVISDLIVKLSADVASFRTSMADSAASVKTLGESFDDAKKKVESLVELLAVAKGVEFIKAAVDATEEWAFSIQKLTQLTGLSTQSAAVFTAIAKEEGVSADVVSTAISRLSLALASHPQKFAQLGIAIRDVNTGALLPMQQILANTVKGLDQYAVGADRDAASAALLGRGFANLLPDLERLGPALNPANFERMGEFLEGLGLAIDQNGIAKAREWEAAQVDLGYEFLAIQNQIGKALLPVITEFGQKVGEYARDGSLKRWTEEAAQGFLSLGLEVVRLGELLIENKGVIELALEGFGAVNIAQGHFVAGTAELGAGVALANSNFDKLVAGLKKTESALVSTKAALATPDQFPETTITGGDDPAAGTKHFTAPPTAAEASATEKFQKLTTELTAQRAEQDALSEAWKRGGVEARGITDKFDAFKASLALGKENTDAQRDSIDKLSLSVKKAAEQAALSEAVSKFSATATNQIQFQKDLSAAYAAGGTAVESITAKEKAHQAVLALGLNATQAAKDAVEKLSLAESQATDDTKRVETLAKSSELLQQNTDYENRLTEAYKEGGRAVITVTDNEKAYQAALALGKNAAAEQIAQIEKLSLTNSAAARATTLAAASYQDLFDTVKSAGGAIEKTFDDLLKPEVGDQKVKEIDKIKKALLGLGTALQDIVVKEAIFKPLEKGLDSLLSDASAAPQAASAATTQNAQTASMEKTWDTLGQGTHISDAFAKTWDTLGSGTHISDAFSKSLHAIGGDISSLFGSDANAPGGSGGVAGPPSPTVSQSGLGTSISQLFAPVLSLFGINIATQTTATTAQATASVTMTTAATALTASATALTASAATLTAAAAAISASAGGSAVSSGASSLGGLFGGLIPGGAGTGAAGAGAGVASSVSSTSLGNPVASNFFRGPDVRGSASPNVTTNVNVHGADPSQVKTTKRKNSTGGYDIEVMLADSVSKNIRDGGKIAQAQRDTFGATRSPIQR